MQDQALLERFQAVTEEVVRTAQVVVSALEARKWTALDVQAARMAGEAIKHQADQVAAMAADLRKTDRRAAVLFAEGLRLMGAACLNVADGIEQSSPALLQVGAEWHRQGCELHRQAFATLGRS